MNNTIKDYFISGNYSDAKSLIDSLIDCSFDEIALLVKELPQNEITAADIPQYSSFEDGTTNLIRHLYLSGNFGPSLTEIGRHYLISDHTKLAYGKYGENHAKLSMLLGATTINSQKPKKVFLNDIGIELNNYSKEEQIDFLLKSAAKIPIIQYSIKNDIRDKNSLKEILSQTLSPSTALRRTSNTWFLLSKFVGE